jgi:branched-chain amino acid aminotransferase
MVEKQKKIWMNGKFLDWDDSKVHVLSHALHYGTGVFEGIRCYEVDGTPRPFKLTEHIERLFKSADIMRIKIPFTKEELIRVCKELIDINNLKACYIRPIAFCDYGPIGVDTSKSPISVAIIVWPWGAYLGEEGVEKGIKINIAPYRRQISELSKAKISGTYYLSAVAKRYAVDNGFDECLMLDTAGNVAEGSGENVFFIKDEKVYTPALGAILPGITRGEVISIVKEKGYDIVEKEITVEEIKQADEVFFTGTAAEITPVVQIEDSVIGDGKPGSMTKKVRELFFLRTQGK